MITSFSSMKMTMMNDDDGFDVDDVNDVDDDDGRET